MNMGTEARVSGGKWARRSEVQPIEVLGKAHCKWNYFSCRSFDTHLTTGVESLLLGQSDHLLDVLADVLGTELRMTHKR